MNRLTLVIAAIFFTFLGEAQIMQPLENNYKASDNVSNVIIKDNHIYYLLNLATSDTNNYIIKSENYFVKIDLNTNQRTYKQLYLDTPYIVSHGFQLVYRKNIFYATVKTYNDSTMPNYNSSILFNQSVLILDTSLNIIKYQKIESTQQFYAPITFDFLSDSILNLSLSNGPGGYPHNATVNLNTGDTNTLVTLNFYPAKSWSLLQDSSWLLTHYGTEWTKYDKNMNNPDTLFMKPLANYELRHKGFSSNYLNSRPVYYARLRHSTISSDRLKMLFVYDYLGDSCIAINTKPQTNADPNFCFYDLDVFNNSKIFTSDVSGGSSVDDFKNTLATNINEITITKYDSIGNILWQKNIGNDAAYFGLTVKATPDSGCIFFATRYDKNINYYENDTYYIKLDKNGNQQLNYLPVSTKEVVKSQLQNVVLYPNPATNTITLQYKNNDAFQLSIHAMDGRLINKANQHFNAPIDVSKLSPGLYTYYITDAKGQFATGLFNKLE